GGLAAPVCVACESGGGDAVAGEAGADEEREPRLPPLPARANASPVCRATNATSVTAASTSMERRIAHLPCVILRTGAQVFLQDFAGRILRQPRPDLHPSRPLLS